MPRFDSTWSCAVTYFTSCAVSLGDVCSISHNIQERGLFLNKACFVLHIIVADYPSMHHYLATKTASIQNHQFKSAVVKLLKEKEGNLTNKERNAATTWQLVTALHHIENAQKSEKISHTQCFEQIKAKCRKKNKHAEILMPNVLPKTSLSARSVPSASKWDFTDILKRISPVLFKTFLFLRLNR